MHLMGMIGELPLNFIVLWPPLSVIIIMLYSVESCFDDNL
jgi:hypothetical protein